MTETFNDGDEDCDSCIAYVGRVEPGPYHFSQWGKELAKALSLCMTVELAEEEFHASPFRSPSKLFATK